MSDPFIFISHKHTDREIAAQIADFLRERSGAKIPIHNSSDPKYEGPRAGQNLNDALRSALAETTVLLLVYTDASHDWAYCMWECGVATDPANVESTRVIVLQCGAESPAPYGDQLRVDVRDLNSLQGFVSDFMTSPDFFPGHLEPLTNFAKSGTEVTHATEDFSKRLTPVLPSGRTAGRRSTPFVRIELERSAVEAIREDEEDNPWLVAADQLREFGRVAAFDKAEIVFGRDLGGERLAQLLDSWQPGEEPDDFFSSIAEQVGAASRRRFPSRIQWTPFEDSDVRRVPFLAESRELSNGSWHFDIYLVPLVPPATPASERMLPIESTFYKTILEGQEAELNLAAFSRELEARPEATRIPILDENRILRYIVHRSMLDKFIAQRAVRNEEVSALTLAHVLSEPQMEAMFTRTAGFVAIEATIEQARKSMVDVGGQDVFVTTDGQPKSPVIGWLPNVEFVKAPV